VLRQISFSHRMDYNIVTTEYIKSAVRDLARRPASNPMTLGAKASRFSGTISAIRQRSTYLVCVKQGRFFN
jgi:hypothetical protein